MGLFFYKDNDLIFTNPPCRCPLLYLNHSYLVVTLLVMIRLLSFFYLITRKINSDYNGTLEITWYNGKKQLNTKNANYSYGLLQKILKIGLQKIDLRPSKNILLLGLGGGSVIKTLRDDFDYQQYITAIDIDPVIINIAQ